MGRHWPGVDPALALTVAGSNASTADPRAPTAASQPAASVTQHAHQLGRAVLPGQARRPPMRRHRSNLCGAMATCWRCAGAPAARTARSTMAARCALCRPGGVLAVRTFAARARRAGPRQPRSRRRYKSSAALQRLVAYLRLAAAASAAARRTALACRRALVPSNSSSALRDSGAGLPVSEPPPPPISWRSTTGPPWRQARMRRQPPRTRRARRRARRGGADLRSVFGPAAEAGTCCGLTGAAGTACPRSQQHRVSIGGCTDGSP